MEMMKGQLGKSKEKKKGKWTRNLFLQFVPPATPARYVTRAGDVRTAHA